MHGFYCEHLLIRTLDGSAVAQTFPGREHTGATTDTVSAELPLRDKSGLGRASPAGS